MYLKSIFTKLFLAAVLLMPASVFAQQAPIFFDAFLFDNAGQPAENFNLFLQWEVTEGSVDLVGGNVPGAPDQTNGRFVELGGSTGDPGRFATRVPFPFVTGATYNIRFDYKSSDGNINTAQVNIGSQTYQFSTASTELQSFSQNFSFSSLTTAPIVFQNLDNDNNGVGIDNVILSQVLVPTAAQVRVGGRVTTAGGRGIGGITITMNDAQGNVLSTRTSGLGYYFFDGVPVGETYVFTAQSNKKYRFDGGAQVRSVVDAADDLNFIAEGE